jgi:acyl carrier protein
MTTLQIVQDILAEQLGHELLALTPDAVFSDIGADSLDMVEIVMAVESEFDIDISDKEAASLTTIDSLVSLVHNLLPANK